MKQFPRFVVRRMAAIRAHDKDFGERNGRSHAVWMTVDQRGFEICRSEEHTSELQSLMRISYAVFCLKKKTKQKTQYEQQNDQMKNGIKDNTTRMFKTKTKHNTNTPCYYDMHNPDHT